MNPPKNKDLKWLAWDFDNCIAQNTGHPHFKITKPVKGAKEALWYAVEKGWKIVIHTARPWSDYHAIESWMIKKEFPFNKIVCGKLLAHFYIDDRAIEFKGDWKNVIDQL